MKSTPALVNPALLAWARESVNLSVEAAARKAAVKPAVLHSWESGEKRPSIAKARKLASVYKFPLAIFYLSEPPKGFQPIRDFRSRGAGEISPSLAIQHRRAHEKREVAIQLAVALDEPIPAFDAKAQQSEDTTRVGKRLRALLGVSIEDQYSWKTDYQALRSWKTAVEALGVLVFETRSVPVDEMRGFSFSLDPFPIIGLNGSDSVVARIFTIAHELTHLALRTAGLCDENNSSPIEAFCNRAAAEVLVPAAVLLARPEAATPRRELDDSDVQALARSFWVSREVIVYRLFELKRITRAMKDDALGRIKRDNALKKASSGPVPPHRMALKLLGPRLTRLVISAYRGDAITISDASSILELKLQHLPKLEQTLASQATE